MDPSLQFCPNFYCLHRGKAGLGNIRAHSRKERRYRCTTCGKTFAATKNTPFYRLHKPMELMTIVLTLLTHGCPRQAVVAAYNLDERTVADWEQRAGRHAQRFHELNVQQGRVEAQHIQADELWVKMVGRKLWMAMAMAVDSRLWLGGILSRRRDGQLITALVQKVKRCLRSLAVRYGFINLQNVERLFFGNEIVHADDGFFLFVHGYLVAVGGFRDFSLRIAALDGGDHATHGVDTIDVFPGTALDVVGERFDEVGAAERVNSIGDAGFVSDDLLRAQSDGGGKFGGQRPSFVERIGVKGLRAA